MDIGNKNIMDKYSFNLKENENFVFEYIALFSMFFQYKSQWEIEDEDCEKNEINSSNLYREWLKTYLDYYKQSYIKDSYIFDNTEYEIPIDLYNPGAPIYLTKFEYEQILSILSTEYALALINKNRPSFGDSLGVRYIKETFFTYFTTDIKYTTSGYTSSQRPSVSNPNLKKWPELKLLTTYELLVSGLFSALCEDAESSTEFKVFKENLKEYYKCFGQQDIKLLDMAVSNLGDGVYVTPRIAKSLLEDLKDILEKDPDIHETDSKVEAINFILDVIIRLSPRYWEKDYKEDLDEFKQHIRIHPIVRILNYGIEIYSEDSVFGRKEWIKEFFTEIRPDRNKWVPISKYFKDFKSIN